MPFVLKVQRQIYGGAAHTKSLQSAELEGGRGVVHSRQYIKYIKQVSKKILCKKNFCIES